MKKFKILSIFVAFSLLVSVPSDASAFWPTFDIKAVVESIKTKMELLKQTTFIQNITKSASKLNTAFGTFKDTVSKYAIDNIEKIKKRVEKAQEEFERIKEKELKYSERKAQFEAAKEEYNNYKEDYDKAKGFYDDAKAAAKGEGSLIDVIGEATMGNDYATVKENYDNAVKQYDSGMKAYNDARQGIDDAKASVNNAINQAQAIKGDISGAINNAGNIVSSAGDILSNPTSISNIKDSVNNITNSVDNIGNVGDTINKRVDNIETSINNANSSINNAGKNVDSIGKSIESGTKSIEELNDQAVKVRTQGFSGPSAEMIAAQQEAAAAAVGEGPLFKSVLGQTILDTAAGAATGQKVNVGETVGGVKSQYREKFSTGTSSGTDSNAGNSETPDSSSTTPEPNGDKTSFNIRHFSEKLMFAAQVDTASSASSNFFADGVKNGQFVFSDKLSEFCQMKPDDVASSKVVTACVDKLVECMTNPLATVSIECQGIYNVIMKDSFAAGISEGLKSKNEAIDYIAKTLPKLEEDSAGATEFRSDQAMATFSTREVVTILNKISETYGSRLAIDTLTRLREVDRKTYDAGKDQGV